MYWTLDVSRTASYEITLVHLSVCPYVRPSLSFLKIGSLVFSDIAHDDSWPWYLMTDRARFLKTNFGGSNLGQMGQNWAQNLVFCYFCKFGLLVFLEIACNDSLQQCLTCILGKIHETNFWSPNLGHICRNRSWN